MKHSLPVLIASHNEEFRALLREMLEKSGFFHILEAASDEEVENFFANHSSASLSLIHESVLSAKSIRLLSQKEHYLILARPENENIVSWTAQLGVEHFLSFPFSSERLVTKINRIFQ